MDKRDPVLRRQRLDAADAGDDFIFKCKGTLGLNLPNDPQGAVIERWVSPDQERTAFSLAKLLNEQLLVVLLNPRMPVLNIHFVVGWVLGSLRRLETSETIIPIFDISLAYFQPEPLKGLFLHTLVRDEEYVHLIERVNRLYGHIVGISGTDADD
jgi:hypothetical protein